MNSLHFTLKWLSFQRKICQMSLLIGLSLWSIFTHGQVNTGGNATTSQHQKQVIGYITNWDAWKNAQAGVPTAGALTHLNIDYAKYTILNYSFFGVANDGSHDIIVPNNQGNQNRIMVRGSNHIFFDIMRY